MRRAVAIVSGVAVVVVLVVFFGRGRLWGESALEVVYPIDGSVFPPDLVAPTFLWRDKDSEANHWTIEVAGGRTGEPLRFDCKGAPPPPGEIDKRCISSTNELYTPYVKDGPVHSWTPDAETWTRIKQLCGKSGATVTIAGARKDQPLKALSTGRITISVSEDPVGAPVFYRDVPLCPSKTKRGTIKPLAKGALPLIVWRLRDLSKPQSRIVMEDVPSCANCHTFSRDGKTLGMDIDGPEGDKGAYTLAAVKEKMVIEGEDLITWNSFPGRPKGHKTIGFMSQVSPDGQYVVSTVNEEVHVANFTDYKFVQVFYPTRGILAYYSRRTGKIEALPGADDPEYVHCSPTWSPDGKYLVFARAKARDPYPAGAPEPEYANDPKELKIQYDLYRIPFNDGKGGQATPVEGAWRNDKSNTFPRISPDGRWIVFVKCRNGQLMRPDSRLWIVPAAGGEAREMRCNTSLMNSWHSFSPNGRWMVFSSKSNTPYTQMFLTHIDEEGRDSPPILVPNSTASNRAVNLPEFANIAYDDLVNIDVPAVDWRRPSDRGLEFLEKGKHREALEQFTESLRIDPQQAQTHFFAGTVFKDMRLGDRAIEHYNKAIEINSEHVDAHCNLGVVLRQQGKFRRAIEHYKAALAINPRHAAAHSNWGTALINLGKVDQAVEHYRKAVEIEPTLAAARRNLARALNRQKDIRQRIIRLQDAVAISPANIKFRVTLSNALVQQGKFAQAVTHLKKALEIDSSNIPALNDMAWLLATCPDDGVRNGARAVELAGKACQATGHKVVTLMDTLAAAYAEAGKFPEAVATATKALGLTKPAQKPLADRIRRRLELYKASRPYRQQN